MQAQSRGIRCSLKTSDLQEVKSVTHTIDQTSGDKNRNKRRKLRPSKNLHTREKGKVVLQLWLYAENWTETEFKLGLEPEKMSCHGCGFLPYRNEKSLKYL